MPFKSIVSRFSLPGPRKYTTGLRSHLGNSLGTANAPFTSLPVLSFSPRHLIHHGNPNTDEAWPLTARQDTFPIPTRSSRQSPSVNSIFSRTRCHLPPWPPIVATTSKEISSNIRHRNRSPHQRRTELRQSVGRGSLRGPGHGRRPRHRPRQRRCWRPR